MTKQVVKASSKKPLRAKKTDGNITQIVKINIDNDGTTPKKRRRRKQTTQPNNAELEALTNAFGSTGLDTSYIKPPLRSAIFRENLRTSPFIIPTMTDQQMNRINNPAPPVQPNINTNITNPQPNINITNPPPDLSGISAMMQLYTQALQPVLQTNVPQPQPAPIASASASAPAPIASAPIPIAPATPMMISSKPSSITPPPTAPPSPQPITASAVAIPIISAAAAFDKPENDNVNPGTRKAPETLTAQKLEKRIDKDLGNGNFKYAHKDISALEDILTVTDPSLPNYSSIQQMITDVKQKYNDALKTQSKNYKPYS